MRYLIIGLCVLSLSAVSCKEKTKEMKTNSDKASYVIGHNFGKNLHSQIPEDQLSVDLLIQGLREGATGIEIKVAQADQQTIMQEFQKAVMASKANAKPAVDPASAAPAQDTNAAATKNLVEGQAYLEKNKKNPSVTVTGSGLQYKVLKAGSGQKPTSADKVKVHYRGTLIDGTKFDSSYDRNQPATFPVTGVIRGWVEALQLMPVGSKWELTIPSNLAYGEGGTGPLIKGNAVLVFEVELLEIVK